MGQVGVWTADFQAHQEKCRIICHQTLLRGQQQEHRLLISGDWPVEGGVLWLSIAEGRRLYDGE